MQFYDGTNKNGLCQKVDRLCDSTDTSYPRLDKTSEINQSYEKVVSWIINADGTWQFDDSNKTDLPRATFNLTEGQEPYTFASDYLQIEHMDVRKSATDPWIRLIPLDRQELGDLTTEEYFGVDSSGNPSKGIPTHFDMITDDSFRLYPAPAAADMTLASGARVTFKRSPTAFTATSATTDDSTVPGFVASFHEILAYMASIPYCIKYHPDRVGAYLQIIGDFPQPTGMKKGLLEHYSYREKAKRHIISPRLTPHM